METTGLRPSWRDRIVEVGVVLLDPHGLVTGEWSTLVNPERDLGQQRTYGVTAADVRHALGLQGDRRESRRSVAWAGARGAQSSFRSRVPGARVRPG
ncbi:hypothetical protein ACFSTC_38015 [Nonomuraea ferruginea]